VPHIYPNKKKIQERKTKNVEFPVFRVLSVHKKKHPTLPAHFLNCFGFLFLLRLMQSHHINYHFRAI
jgi:hypothetical protein